MPSRRVEILDDIQSCTSESKIRAQWEEIPMSQLKEGHVYRMFEKDGEPVDGGEVCVALEDAKLYERPGHPSEDNYIVESKTLKGW